MGAEGDLNGPQDVEQFKRGLIVPPHTALVANDLDLPANVFSAFQKMAIGQEQVGPFLSGRDHRRARQRENCNAPFPAPVPSQLVRLAERRIAGIARVTDAAPCIDIPCAACIPDCLEMDQRDADGGQKLFELSFRCGF